MFDNVNGVQLTVFTILCIAVSVLGFLAGPLAPRRRPRAPR